MRHALILLLIWTIAGPNTLWGDTPPTITRKTIKVPMRDGVLLATDVYSLPDTPRGPVLLMRSPYNKLGGKSAAERFAAAGYIAVVQDCRGRHESEGTFVPYNNEGQDGFDTIEWLTQQTWCNGQIGMWGSSYVGATQWQAAVEHPPGLVTITPTATFSSFYRNLYLGGAVRLSLITGWASSQSVRPANAELTKDWNHTIRFLPLSNIDREIGWPIPWLEGMLTHTTPNGYWKRLDMTDEITDLKMPIQHVVGVYDFFSRESVNNFVRMQKQAKDPETRRTQQLILGPWDHGTIGKSKVGEIDFGPRAELDALGENLAWFDRVLKPNSAAASKPIPAVRYFSMGDNAWHEAATWPPHSTDPTRFYLHSEGRANTSQGNGRLDRHPPQADEPADAFRADPDNPVPACPVTSSRDLFAATWAPVDQRTIEERNDVLVYSTEPLKEPLTFAGDAQLELFVSADTPDADWVAKLIDVHPNGFSQNLAVGILRGRFRDSEQSPTLLQPDQVYRLLIDLGPIAAQLQPGHRLRIDICGSYFPLFDRNPNTGEGPFGKKTTISTEKVYHGLKTGSRLLLPCLP
ncbi:CocE/NonD family hydrolase [Schlesneria paludicola]|uniref:CocE/NonD family hydrolase n=1 Tax=Schlesneria paludicola TaxID=360056 RepID=UPI00029B4D27|nr:CocE/NonD family hydrolase [Schlesneria paludicola]